jgi:molybdate transport system regulatory protein
MKTKQKPAGAPVLRPRFRIVRGKKIAFGPGKAELLDLIAQTGSIGEAATRMEMSYMRAWTLVGEMNQCFCAPVVKSARGGREHGGAALTDTGRRALALYRRIEETGLKSVQPDWRALKKLLRG